MKALTATLSVFGVSFGIGVAQAVEPTESSSGSFNVNFVQEGAFRVTLPPRVFTTRCHNWLLYYCEEISKFPRYSAEARGYYNEAVSLHQAGFLNKANILYKKAIEIEPDFSEAYSNLGAVYYLQKSIDKAKQCFEYSLNCTHGESDVPLRYLARISSSESDDVKAADYWQRAITVAEKKPNLAYPDLLREYTQFLHKTHRDVEAIVYEEKLKEYLR
jgi:tetratricopeptide (TPR) repeat protein